MPVPSSLCCAEFHPRLRARDDQVAERLLGEIGLASQPPDERFVGAEAVAADGGDAALEVLQVAVVLEGEVTPAEARLVADDRHQFLAREVAAHDQDVDAVELARVDQLAKQVSEPWMSETKKSFNPARLYDPQSL